MDNTVGMPLILKSILDDVELRAEDAANEDLRMTVKTTCYNSSVVVNGSASKPHAEGRISCGIHLGLIVNWSDVLQKMRSVVIHCCHGDEHQAGALRSKLSYRRLEHLHAACSVRASTLQVSGMARNLSREALRLFCVIPECLTELFEVYMFAL